MISDEQRAAIVVYRDEMIRLEAEKLLAEKAVDPTMEELLGRHDLATSSEISEIIGGTGCYWAFEVARRVTALKRKAKDAV